MTHGIDSLMCMPVVRIVQEKELTHFIDVTKHLSGVDRSQMMLQLMRLHGEMFICSCLVLVFVSNSD